MFTSNLPYVFPFFLFVSSHLCLCHITFTFIFNGLPVATHLLSGPSSSLSKTRSSFLSFIFWYCLLLLSPASSAKYSRLQSSSASKCEAIQLPTMTCTSEAFGFTSYLLGIPYLLHADKRADIVIRNWDI